MHNSLARATWPDGGQYDLDLVMHIASKIRTDDEDFKTYRFPVAELGYGKNLDGRTYERIREAMERLTKSAIKIEEKNTVYFFSLFSMIGYEDGAVVARFDPEMKQFFLHLTAHFTSFELLEMRMLPSEYSKRLFLLLKSFSSLTESRIALADLHNKLLTPESFRSDFAQFRRWVLDKAQKDLQNALPFEWEPIRKGRGVTAIRFMFSRKKRNLAKHQKTATEQHNKSKSRNNLMFAAVTCAKDKQPPCPETANKADVCAICREYGILKS